MIVYWVLVVFIFGLAVGSFLNVVIYRTVKGESPWKGRSHCPHCGKLIPWKHNIPLLSFVFLRGKCADCDRKISWQYPVVEIMTGILFVWWLMVGKGFFLLVNSPFAYVQPIFWLGVGVMLLMVFVFDIWYGVIPNGLNLLMFAWVFLYRSALVATGVMQARDFLWSIVAAAVLWGFFYALYWITRRKGFGLGDVKLAPSLGLLLGGRLTLVASMAAFFSGAVVGIVLMFLGKKKFGQTIPFGPFLVIGCLIALVWGEMIWQWYVSMLG